MATTDALEKSIEGSRPVELYTFVQGSDQFFYTSAEGTVSFLGTDYLPLSIKRGNPVQSREQKSTQLVLTAPAVSDIATPFIPVQPSVEMTVSIQRIQPDETPSLSTSILMFEGFVSSVAFKDEIAEFRCIPFNELFTREIPRFQYQGLCNHVLYDTRCKVNKALFQHSGAVLSVDGNQIQISGLPTTNLPFIGGYIEIPGVGQPRLVLDQVGDVVTILIPFTQDVVGVTIDAFQGCDHTATVCAQKFNNILNYGGFPFVPTVNPFQQTQITKE